MKVKVYNAGNQPTPSYQTDGAAAFDLYANSAYIDKEHGVIRYGTGLHFEIPNGYYGKIVPRSSIYKKKLVLSNHSGVIDSDYRGEVSAIFRHILGSHNLFIPELPYNGNSNSIYLIGDRIAQMMILPVGQVEFVEIESAMLLGKTLRGEGGFGSTGK